MKKILLIIALFSTINAKSQLTTEEINFDNFISSTDNDLVNNFTEINPNSYELVSDENNGYLLKTSLGGLATEAIKLCSKYRGIDTEIMKISMDFKVELYATPISFTYNAVGIFLTNDEGLSGFSTRIDNSSELLIGGLTNPNSTYNPSFWGADVKDNNWYKLEFQISKIEENKFSVSSKIYDLGTDRTSTPDLIINNTKTGFNYNFNENNNFNIEIVGGWWGDVKYLDNLKIYGFKNGSNCQVTSINNKNGVKEIDLLPNPFTDKIHLKSKVKKINIYNLNGQLIDDFSNPSSPLSLNHLSKGTYIFEIFTTTGVQRKKIIKK